MSYVTEGKLIQQWPTHWVLKRGGEHLDWSGQKLMAAGSEAACRAAARLLGLSIEWTIPLAPGEKGPAPKSLGDDWNDDEYED